MASDTKGMATNERAIKIIVLLHSSFNSFLLYIDLAYSVLLSLMKQEMGWGGSVEMR